jgi:hypothetical protein
MICKFAKRATQSWVDKNQIPWVIDLLIAIGVFMITLVVYFNFATAASWGQGADNRWYFPAAWSLMKDGTISLVHFKADIQAINNWGIEQTSIGPVNYFPIGPSILALPFLVVHADQSFTTFTDFFYIASFAAKSYAALSVLLIFIISRLSGVDRLGAILLSILFGFCSPHFSTHAGGYWSHNVSSFLALLLIGLILLAIRFQSSTVLARNNLYLIGLSIGFVSILGYATRPDFSILIFASFGFLFYFNRKIFAASIYAGSLFALIFIWFSFSIYGSITPPYYSATRVGWPSFDILLVQLLSPNRGLLVYSPFFALSVTSLYYVRRFSGSMWIFYGVIALSVIGSIIVISGFPHWWGGHAFGPRIHASQFGLLSVSCIPFFLWLQESSPNIRKLGLSALFIFGAAGLFINTAGAIFQESIQWNSSPIGVDARPERVSDWSDIQWLRGYRSMICDK